MSLISLGDQVLTKNVYGTDETLLFETNTPTSSCNLSESIENFERVKIMFSINENCQISEFCSTETNQHKNLITFGNAPDSFAWAKQNLRFSGSNITVTSAWAFVGLNTNTYDANNNTYAMNSIGKVWGINRKEGV